MEAKIIEARGSWSLLNAPDLRTPHNFDSPPKFGATLSYTMEVALEAAARAGAIIKGKNPKEAKVSQKEVGQLVTEVDLEAEREILDFLTRAAPGIPVVSEESSPDLRPSGDCFIVDPLDGTSSFTFRLGNEIPAVLIAARGEVNLGVAYFPLTGEWFFAQESKGAYKNNGEPLIIDPTDQSISSSLIAMNQNQNIEEASSSFEKLHRALRSPVDGARQVIAPIPHSGMGVRLAEGSSEIAAIVHDNNPHKVKQGPWDVAPIQTILEEAGGVVLGKDGEPYDIYSGGIIIMSRSRKLAEELVAKMAA